jgi:hypothetical protein
MKHTTVSLPDGVAAALAREARRRNVSASEIAREALAKHLRLVADGPRDLPFATVGRSGHARTAREMEELLARKWDDETDRR